MYDYFNKEFISGEEVGISTSFPNKKAILAYASSPTIQPKDISLNILSSDLKVEENFVPNISSLYLNKGIKVWEKELSENNESQKFSLTNIFDEEGNPLYYKEEIGYISNIKNITVLNDGVEEQDSFKLITINNILYIYHSYDKEDNCSFIVVMNDNTEKVMYPLYLPAIIKVEKERNIGEEGDIYWIEGNKLYIRLQSEEYEYQVLNSKDFRGRMPIAFNLTGTAKIDWKTLSQKDISLGVCFLEDTLKHTFKDDDIDVSTVDGSTTCTLKTTDENIFYSFFDKEVFINEQAENGSLFKRFYFISNNLCSKETNETGTIYKIQIPDCQSTTKSIILDRYMKNGTETFLTDIKKYFNKINLKDNSAIIPIADINTEGSKYDVVILAGTGHHSEEELTKFIKNTISNENGPLVILDSYADINNGLYIDTETNKHISVKKPEVWIETTYGAVSKLNIKADSAEDIVKESQSVYKNSVSSLSTYMSPSEAFIDTCASGTNNGCSTIYNKGSYYFGTVYTKNPYILDVESYADKLDTEFLGDLGVDTTTHTIIKIKNLVVSSQGITLTRNNKNVPEGIHLIEKLILKHFASISFETPIEKDYIIPKNSLRQIDFDVNNYEIGYENIDGKNMFVGRKMISTNINNYILSFLGLDNIYKIDIASLNIKYYDRFYNEIEKEKDPTGTYTNNLTDIKCHIAPNEPFYFYLPIDISSVEEPNPKKYNDILNEKEDIEFSINLLNGNSIVKTTSRYIALKYLPRKSIINKLTYILEDEIKETEYDAISIVPKNTDVNIYIKKIGTTKYYTNDGLAYIKKEVIDDNIVIEASLTTYSIISSNTKLSIKNEDFYKDIIKIDNNLKTSVPWYPSVKKISSEISDSNYTYLYETPEFDKQLFIKNNSVRKIEKEKASFININSIQCSHNNICKDQNIVTTNETLERITGYVFFAKNKIDELVSLKNSRGEEVSANSYTIDNNFIIFNNEISESATFIISYRTNNLNIYYYDNNLNVKVKAPLLPMYNSTKILKIDKEAYSLLNENGLVVWKEVLNGDKIQYEEIDPNELTILQDCGIIIIKTNNAEMYNYYWSGVCCKKTNCSISEINYDIGIINLKDKIDYRKTVYCDYLYDEEYFYYKGYKDNHLDLNPLIGHKYSINGLEADSIELVGKPIYIYLKPYQIKDKNGFIIEENDQTIFHTFDKNEIESLSNNKGIVVLAVLCLTNNYDLYDVNIMDARTLGGGLKEGALINDFEAQFFFDVLNNYNMSYNPNGFAVIRLPKQLLKENQGMFNNEYIEKIVNMYRPAGIKYVIDYYDAETDPIKNQL